ncbi:unnamed protein product [Arctogadus glacialis]
MQHPSIPCRYFTANAALYILISNEKKRNNFNNLLDFLPVIVILVRPPALIIMRSRVAESTTESPESEKRGEKVWPAKPAVEANLGNFISLF